MPISGNPGSVAAIFRDGRSAGLLVPKAQDEADNILGVSVTAYPAITHC
jgi:hypothetical protein